MEWDCKINFYTETLVSNRRTFKRTLAIFVILILSKLDTANSLYLDCKTIDKCLCSNPEASTFRVECPTGVFSTYPIQFSLKSYTPEEALVDIKCNDPEGLPSEFKWDLIEGVDLSEDKIAAKVTYLIMEMCPPVSDGFKGLINRLKIDATDIKKLTFLSYREIESLPSNFLSEFPNLEILILNSNKLHVLPDLSTVPNITTLNVRDNRLKSLKVGSFTANKNLKKLVLIGHQLESFENEVFPESLDFLDISGPRLSTLGAKFFSNLTNLKTLFVNNAPLDKIDVGCFDNMPNLTFMSLERVKLGKVFPAFRNLPQLTNLSMNGLQFEDENSLIVLKALPLLTKFSSFFSNLINLPILEELPSLKYIELNKNRIQNLTIEFFRRVPSLVVVDLSYNSISELVEIRSPRLEKLYLGKNRITELPDFAFRHLSKLVELQLFKNKIGKVHFGAFDSLGALQYLDLSHNEITFSENPYKNLNSSDVFDEFQNYSPLHQNLALRRVNLSFNHLEKIFSDWRILHLALEELDLSHNHIKFLSIYDLQFPTTKNLQLNLTNNQIKVINLQNFFMILENIIGSMDVYLDGNPLNCNCIAYLLKNFKVQSYQLHFDNLECAEPTNLRGLKITQVSDSEFLCKIDPDHGCTSEKCTCWERPLDEMLLINCSNLNLSENELPPLDMAFNSGLSKWSVEYDFSGNNLSTISNEYLSRLPSNTKHVNLSKNGLQSLDFIENLRENTHTNFSLSNNLFICEKCSDFYAFSWATQSSRILDSEDLTCLTSSGEHININNVTSILPDCKVATGLHALIICLAFFSTMIVILILLIMRYSWIIKAFLFSKGWGWCLFWDSDLDVDDEEKLYDAFVSYSHKDEDWVLDELVNRLEEKEGFKLCLHFRDWTPGDWIPDQIVRSVDQSRRTVVILSKNFVDSVWSRLEFKAAHAQALSQSSNRVILVLLEDDLKDEDVQDDDLRVYMKMNTYLKCNDPWFWHKLKYALPHKKTQEENDNVIKMMQQRERAKELDKIRAKLEQTV